MEAEKKNNLLFTHSHAILSSSNVRYHCINPNIKARILELFQLGGSPHSVCAEYKRFQNQNIKMIGSISLCCSICPDNSYFIFLDVMASREPGLFLVGGLVSWLVGDHCLQIQENIFRTSSCNQLDLQSNKRQNLHSYHSLKHLGLLALNGYSL